MKTFFSAWNQPGNRWLAVLMSVLSGILLTAGFPKLELYPLAWIALIPLFSALQGRNAKQAFILGFICGLAHYVTALYWIRYVIYHYGGIPLPLAIMVLLLLCAYLALYTGCFAVIANRWEQSPLLWVWALPAVWVALEWVRAHALTGFPWASLGYTQTPFEPLVQVADITGVYGISWLIILGNTVLMGWLNQNGLRMNILSSLTVAALFAGMLFYGFSRSEAIKALEAGAAPLRAAVVQGNIDQAQKWEPSYQQETLERYRRLSLEAARQNPRPDLIVWPETSAPFFYGIQEDLSRQLDDIVREVGIPVLFGSPGVKVVDGERRLVNRAYLADETGRPIGYYDKQHLVPFGEYVPYQKVLFFVHKLVQAAGNFAAGDNPAPIEWGDQRLGVLICYEAIFPELAREQLDRGASILVNITNDAWFGMTSAPYQHMEIARWRAVEFRAPLIRSANTGVSAVFDSTGKALGTIPLNEEGYLVAAVQPLYIVTFYAKWGDVFAWICVLTSVGGLLYSTQGLKRRVYSTRKA